MSEQRLCAALNALLLAIDLVLWAVPFPILAVVAYYILIAAHALLCRLLPERLFAREVPLWLESPWDVLTHASFVWHGVRVVDADGVHAWVPPETLAHRGAVFANHRRCRRRLLPSPQLPPNDPTPSRRAHRGGGAASAISSSTHSCLTRPLSRDAWPSPSSSARARSG